MNTTANQLYDTDFYGWTQGQVAAMRAGDWAEVDWEHLIEEVESMGKSQQCALASRLEVPLMYLLKWQFQPLLQGPSWRFTIEEQRVRIAILLQENPSLKSKMATCAETAYMHAKRLAARETGLAADTFPEQCPWALDAILDAQFWPGTSTSPLAAPSPESQAAGGT